MKNITGFMGKHIHRALRAVATVALIGVAIACNDEMERIERGEYPAPGDVALHQNKVLWVIMDGAGGIAVRQAINSDKARNLRSMMSNSVYTFEGLANTDEKIKVNKVTGWQAMLTGTTDEEGQNTSILKRLKEEDNSYKSAVWASDNDFYNLYADDADHKFKGADDTETAKQAINALVSEEAFPDLGIIELNGVELAGQNAGFYDENGQYATDEVLAAISKIDGLIAQIVASLKSRPSYTHENWLLMLSSNYGGLENNEGETVYDMKDRNTFSMIWNERLDGKLLQKPLESELSYNYHAPLFSIQGANSKASVRDPQLFNMHPDSSYTVQFMFREFNTSANGFGSPSGAQTLVSKAEGGRDSWSNGWKVLWQGNNIRMYANPLNNGSHRVTLEKSPQAGARKDDDWHVLTMVFDRKNAHFYSYQDGVSEGRTEDSQLDLNFERYGELATDFPLTIGMINESVSSGKTRFAITNLQIYDVALTPEFIAENYAQTKLEEKQNEYWDNLIGYWPADREEDLYQNVIRDYSQYAESRNGQSDMDITGDWNTASSWIIGSSNSNNAVPLADESFFQRVINTTDLASQTFQWFGIGIDTSWGWEGIARDLPYQSLETTN